MNGEIWAIARWLGLTLSTALRDELAEELAIEIGSFRLYPEAVPVLFALERQGLQLGLCSNLAKPYAPPVLSLLPFEFDAHTWSFEVSAAKPDHRIYRAVCQSLALSPGEVPLSGTPTKLTPWDQDGLGCTQSTLLGTWQVQTPAFCGHYSTCLRIWHFKLRHNRFDHTQRG